MSRFLATVNLPGQRWTTTVEADSFWEAVKVAVVEYNKVFLSPNERDVDPSRAYRVTVQEMEEKTVRRPLMERLASAIRK